MVTAEQPGFRSGCDLRGTHKQMLWLLVSGVDWRTTRVAFGLFPAQKFMHGAAAVQHVTGYCLCHQRGALP